MARLAAAVDRDRLVRLSPLAVGLVALLAVIYFDFGPPLPFNDDWGYAWEAQHTGLDGIQRLPLAQATAFVQAVWGQLATVGHPQEPYLRLSILAFVLLAAASSYRLARNLEADRLWSGVAAMALLTTPIYLNLATSFMTDVPYIALMLAATEAGVRWLRFGRAHGQFLLWTALATLQRQLGMGLPLALTVCLLLRWRTKRPSRGDVLWLAGSWLAVIVIVVAPWALGLSTPAEEAKLNLLTTLDVDSIARGVGFVPPLLGLVLLPFAAGVLFQPRLARARFRFRPRTLVTLAAIGLGLVGGYAAVNHLVAGDWYAGRQVFPGNVWSYLGFLGPFGTNKPALYPDALWLALGIVVVSASLVILVLRARLWGRLSEQPAALFLMTAFAIQVGEVINAFIFDRYLIAAAALLVPLMAAVASRTTRPRLALGWALAAGVAGIALYGVAQQDYEAWQAARDKAVLFAYRFAPRDQVYAGFEPSAVYVIIPQFERDGYLDVPTADAFLTGGPIDGQIGVFFSGPDDPRPGVPYESVAPGKMVVLGPLPANAGSP